MASLDVWDDVDYRGKHMEVRYTLNDLTSVPKDISPFSNWNDEICSWRVNSGQWRMFENVNFGGLGTQILKPGDHVRSCPDAGFPNNWVSSIQLISE
jgi:hypothetical protein